jgi:hypothetical protein
MFMEKIIIYTSKFAEWTLEYRYSDNGYLSYEVNISSYGISGIYVFHNAVSDAEKTIEALERLICEDGAIEFRDMESDSYVRVTKSLAGVYINGTMGGTYNDNYMVFKFRADESILQLLTSAFAAFIRWSK